MMCKRNEKLIEQMYKLEFSKSEISSLEIGVKNEREAFLEWLKEIEDNIIPYDEQIVDKIKELEGKT